MKRAWLVAKKDMNIYFNTPLAYAIIGFFMLLMAFFFNTFLATYLKYMKMYQMGGGGGGISLNRLVEGFYGNLHVVFMILIPGLTMRSFCSERRDHTLELLVTSPIRVWEMVVGKFLGVGSVIIAMLGATLVFPAFLIAFGNPDLNILATTYIGLFLMGMAYVAIGLFTSSVTSNQFIAYLTSFLVGIGFWLMNAYARNADGMMATLLQKTNLLSYFENFTKGTLSSADVVYYFSFFFFWLFLTYRQIDSQSWRS